MTLFLNLKVFFDDVITFFSVFQCSTLMSSVFDNFSSCINSQIDQSNITWIMCKRAFSGYQFYDLDLGLGDFHLWSTCCSNQG